MELRLKQVEKNPELLSEKFEDLEKAVKIPYILKNKILMSPGIWNNYYYKDKAILSAYKNTDWDSKEITSLFLDHQDERSSEWVGWVKNPKQKGKDIIGDLMIVDKPTAIKLYAGAKFGVSPKVRGKEEDGEMKSFVFDNFSIVLNPAVKTAYINNKEKDSELTAFEEVRKKKKMSVEEFYAIPRDPPSESKLPIYDAEHVRNAMARFNQIKGVSDAEKSKAKNKIIKAAKKFGIKISDEDFKKNKEESKMAEEEKSKPKEEEKSQENEDIMSKVKKPVSEIADILGVKVTKVMDVLGPLMKSDEKPEEKENDEGEEEEEEKQPEKKEEPSEDEKKSKEEESKEENKEQISDAEVLEITKNSEWPKFAEKADSKKSLKEMAIEFKKQQDKRMSEELSEKMNTIAELKGRLDKVEKKMQEPAKLSMKTSAMSLKEEDDPDKGFLQTLQSM
ncbi:MAG: DUF6582 domain-containing protein [Elusimicrobiota bacterium]